MEKRTYRIWIESSNWEITEGLLKRFDEPRVLDFCDISINSSHFNLMKFKILNYRSAPVVQSKYDKIWEDNNIFVYDLNNCDLSVVEGHSKYLKLVEKMPQNKKIILLSNVYTWENAFPILKETTEEQRSFEFEQNDEEQLDETNKLEEEPEEDMAMEVSEDEATDNKPETENPRIVAEYFQKEDFLRRMGHDKYMQMIAVENVMLFLKEQIPELTLNILCPGVIYGSKHSLINELIEFAFLQKPNRLHLIGDGSNEIPMIHLRDLITCLHYFITEDTKSEKYFFVADRNKKRTQRQLLKYVSTKIGSGVFGRATGKEEEVYSESLTRVLQIDVKWKVSNLIEKHMEKVKSMKEAEQEQWALEDEEESRRLEEETKNDEQEVEPLVYIPPLRKSKVMDINYTLEFRGGIIENIDKIKWDWIRDQNYIQFKISVIGSPYSGKTHLSKNLSKHFNVPYISLREQVEIIRRQKSELGEELNAFIEEKQEEMFNRLTEEYETAVSRKKTWIKKPPNKESIEIELSQKLLLKLMRHILSKNDCVNRGYVLDGFPNNFQETKLIFESYLNRKNKTTQRKCRRRRTSC